MGWRAKVGDRLTQFQGKYVTGQNVTQEKKDKSRERCLSKLGNCPPWYLSHSNLISPNRLHYCCCSPPLTRDFLLFPSLHSLSTRLVRHLQGDKCVLQTVCCVFTSIRPRIRGSQADAAPGVTRPASFPLHFRLPSLFPLIPLAHCKEKNRNTEWTREDMGTVFQKNVGICLKCWNKRDNDSL